MDDLEFYLIINKNVRKIQQLVSNGYKFEQYNIMDIVSDDKNVIEYLFEESKKMKMDMENIRQLEF